MTHSQIIDIMQPFVLKRFSCGVAFKELKTLSSECADVIGFGGHTHSVLIEVKVSRSDFLADKNKSSRKHPERGIGRYRFYACPDELICKDDLPEGWGLIWIDAVGTPIIVANPYCVALNGNIWEGGFEFNKQAERDILYSALRRK